MVAVSQLMEKTHAKELKVPTSLTENGLRDCPKLSKS